jgi:hypothetical protein
MKRLLALALVASLSSSAYGIGPILPSDPQLDGWLMHTEPNFTYVRPDVQQTPREAGLGQWVQYDTNFWAESQLATFQFSNAPSASVPEPSTITLAGIAVLALLRRRLARQ